MKKRFVLALVAAAMFSAPIAQAGFSSKPSSSSVSKPAAPKPSAPAPKPAAPSPAKQSNYGSMSSWSAPKKEEPKRDYGYVAKPAEAAPKQAAPAPVQSPAPVSGFSAAPKDKQATGSVGKKVAGVAAATALGGALYAAGANHEAVAAYEAPAHKTESADVGKTAQTGDATKTAQATEPTKTEKATVAPAAKTWDTPVTHAPASQQPQVVVIQQEAPRYRHDSHDDAYWYQRGRDSAYRDQQQAGGTYTMPAPTVATPSVQSVPTAPAHVAPAAHDNSGSVLGFLAFMLVLVLIAVALFYWANRDTRKKTPATADKNKPNYTL